MTPLAGMDYKAGERGDQSLSKGCEVVRVLAGEARGLRNPGVTPVSKRHRGRGQPTSAAMVYEKGPVSAPPQRPVSAQQNEITAQERACQKKRK